MEQITINEKNVAVTNSSILTVERFNIFTVDSFTGSNHIGNLTMLAIWFIINPNINGEIYAAYLLGI